MIIRVWVKVKTVNKGLKYSSKGMCGRLEDDCDKNARGDIK